ncbi:hypothetical protein CLOP_g10197 [Closterium sp. NIES-67]|nr:hypothetical protein CLOP_g10197 [Closterium sp. NIES-67]
MSAGPVDEASSARSRFWTSARSSREKSEFRRLRGRSKRKPRGIWPIRVFPAVLLVLIVLARSTLSESSECSSGSSSSSSSRSESSSECGIDSRSSGSSSGGGSSGGGSSECSSESRDLSGLDVIGTSQGDTAAHADSGLGGESDDEIDHEIGERFEDELDQLYGDHDGDNSDGLFEDAVEHAFEEDGEFLDQDSEFPFDEGVEMEGWDDADDDVVGADAEDDVEDDAEVDEDVWSDSDDDDNEGFSTDGNDDDDNRFENDGFESGDFENDGFENIDSDNGGFESDLGSGSDWDSDSDIDPDFDLSDIFAYEREGSAMVPLPVREARLVDELLTWMERHGDQSKEGGGLRSKIQVLAITSPAFYSCAPPTPPLPSRLPLGILSSSHTAPGSTLIPIPFPLWLSKRHGGWDSRLNRPASPPPAPYKHAGDDVTVAAWLLREWKRGSASFYAPWINLLPGYVPLPIFWDEGTLQELDSGEMVERVEESLRYVEEAYSLCSPDSIAGASLDDFKWAVSIVWSRSVPISAVGLKDREKRGKRRGKGGKGRKGKKGRGSGEGGGKGEQEEADEEDFWQYMEEEAEGEEEEGEGGEGVGEEGEEVHMLLPLLDLFNHEFYYTADWQPTIHSSTADINIFAADVISPGGPISVGYGSMDNAQFLLLYGFVPPNNPFDRFVLFENTAELLDYYETKYLAAATEGTLEGVDSGTGAVAGTDGDKGTDFSEKYPWLTGSFDRDLAAALVTTAISAVEARQPHYTAEHELDQQLLGMAAGAVGGSEALAIGREGYVDARLLAALAALSQSSRDTALDSQALAEAILRFVFRGGVTCDSLKQQQVYHLAVVEAPAASAGRGGGRREQEGRVMEEDQATVQWMQQHALQCSQGP